MLFINYPKCSTCKNAKNFLEEKNFNFTSQDIKLNPPTKEELKIYHEKSGLDIKKFFNTSGLVYKSLNLKDKLPTMTLDEKLEILSSDGMLIKRPILVLEDKVLVGFKKNEWENI